VRAARGAQLGRVLGDQVRSLLKAGEQAGLADGALNIPVGVGPVGELLSDSAAEQSLQPLGAPVGPDLEGAQPLIVGPCHAQLGDDLTAIAGQIGDVVDGPAAGIAVVLCEAPDVLGGLIGRPGCLHEGLDGLQVRRGLLG